MLIAMKIIYLADCLKFKNYKLFFTLNCYKDVLYIMSTGRVIELQGMVKEQGFSFLSALFISIMFGIITISLFKAVALFKASLLTAVEYNFLYLVNKYKNFKHAFIKLPIFA